MFSSFGFPRHMAVQDFVSGLARFIYDIVAIWKCIVSYQSLKAAPTMAKSISISTLCFKLNNTIIKSYSIVFLIGISKFRFGQNVRVRNNIG